MHQYIPVHSPVSFCVLCCYSNVPETKHKLLQSCAKYYLRCHTDDWKISNELLNMKKKSGHSLIIGNTLAFA
jgi:hypothetical protein